MDNLPKPELENAGGYFRGVAALLRVKAPILKAGVRAVGEARPLAFASEVGVAGRPLMSNVIYYGCWGLSGVAIAADITTKAWDAPEDKKMNTVLYHTAFHVPASLVIPAYIIHQVVHGMEHSMQHHNYAKNLPPRLKAVAPVAAALVAIVPVVPTVDHTAEMILEPTLGKYLGLEFSHHHKAHTGPKETKAE
eukprot:TRINITY_DN33413_c0_g1_i1.p1 TRINITY_DN33413_c0_g1~~TRINITY_DN33413_c0_g1_i1.p1  ORF type:complete len:216 (-),score=32.71 TRINITY_DN33413_c0_g1_i1:360-938(-)